MSLAILYNYTVRPSIIDDPGEANQKLDRSPFEVKGSGFFSGPCALYSIYVWVVMIVMTVTVKTAMIVMEILILMMLMMLMIVYATFLI